MARRIESRIATALAARLVGDRLEPGGAAEEWKFAIEEIEGSVQDAYAQKFKELIEEKTGGEVTVTIYPYGTLGTSADLTELVNQGAIQFANASPGHLGTMVPEIQVFSIPYLLSEENSVNKQVLTESEVIYNQLQEDFHDKGLHLLTMYPEGEMVWTTNKEIRSPEDFDNFKMRTMVSPMLVAAYEAYGASPTPMPYGEVYGGLQLGQIDGQVNPIFAIEEMKFYEVTDYMIFSGEQEFVTTVVTNSDWYQADLSDENKQVARRDHQRARRLHLRGPGAVQPGAAREDQGREARDGDHRADRKRSARRSRSAPRTCARPMSRWSAARPSRC